MRKAVYILLSVLGIFGLRDLALAQVISDMSTGTRVTSDPKRVNRHFIEGGTLVGNSLFHSFREFSIPENHVFRFRPSSPRNIQTIFSRVTGNKTSHLQGILRSNNNLKADLILLNPNGIVFHENFKLDINGSFLATTAESVLFEGGDRFSTDLSQSSALLTLSVPIGLQFGSNPRPIHVMTGKPGIGFKNGISVDEFQDLALIGGDILLDTGKLIAPGGNVWLASIQQPGILPWTVGETWSFEPQALQEYGEIHLKESSRIFSSFDPQKGVGANKINGPISIFGDQIKIENSEINAENFGRDVGANIVIDATESIQLLTTNSSAQSTILTTQTLGRGRSGNIQLSAPILQIEGGRTRGESKNAQTRIVTSSAKDNPRRVSLDKIGGPGDILLRGEEKVSLKGDAVVLAVTSSVDAPSGNIKVMSKRLEVLGGAQIRSSTESEQIGGTIDVETEESIVLSGFFDFTRNGVRIFRPSGFTTDANRDNQGGIIRVKTPYLRIENGAAIVSNVPDVGNQAPIDRGVGRSGAIVINTERLELINGGQILANAKNEEAGTAGEINIQAEQYVEIKGNILLPNAQTLLENRVSGIQAETNTQQENSVKTGDIVLKTPRLSLQNGALISANSNSTQGGNIKFDISERLVLDRSSRVVSNTQTGVGGDIDITTRKIEITEGSQIIANAEDMEAGSAGNIDIQAKDYILVRGNSGTRNDASPSGIQVETQAQQTTVNKTGNVELKTPILVLQDGALISANSQGTQGGNIILDISDLLFLNQSSRIISNAKTGNGGSVVVRGFPWIIAPLGSNSDITANSEQGNGGRIFFDNRGIEGFNIIEVPLTLAQLTALSRNRINDVAASSGRPNRQGKVVINNLDTLTRQFEKLETSLEQPSKFDNCQPGSPGQISDLKLIGRGGLRVVGRRELIPIWEDTRLAPLQLPQPQIKDAPVSEIIQPIIQATGWSQSKNGDIALTYHHQTNLQASLPMSSLVACHSLPSG